MHENEKKYYFSIMKELCILFIMSYFVYYSEKSLHRISVEWFLLAIFLFASLGFELTDSNVKPKTAQENHISYLKELLSPNTHRIKLLYLGTEIIITCLLLTVFQDHLVGYYLYPFLLLDCIFFLRLPLAYYMLLLPVILMNSQNLMIYIVYCFFISVIYYQNFVLISRYKKYIEDFEEEEYLLKDSIHTKDTIYKEELEKSSLTFENQMLEEKARLSQALHDKLGHSINGSVYQLEACKLLMEKEPEQSSKIMQGVIDNLRSSMDEIRKILRREKPDKKRMAYLQLLQLCEECKHKYGIFAKVTIEGENKDIPELIWDIILDNTIEAVTNALKYAKCSEINIEIAILHKVIRCIIHDNGIGCAQLAEGMGLQGMINRTRKVNGFLDINAENGFRINMIIPL